jgi:predicted ATPase
VIVTARPDLLDRRPAWGGGKIRATTITLNPLSDDDTTHLLALLCARNGTSGRRHGVSGTGVTGVLHTVASCVGGNPLFIIEYARMLREDGPTGFRDPHEADELLDTGRVDLPLHIPQSVHRILTSRLDSLPAEVKAVLLDAAVLGDFVCAAGLVAVGGRAAGEVSQCLEYLERWEFLTQTSREPDVSAASYVFRNALVRDVAYQMIPRTTRADKHERATAWLGRLPGQHTKLLAYHQRQATVLSVPADGDTVSVQQRVCRTFSAAGLPEAVAVPQPRSRSGHT